MPQVIFLKLQSKVINEVSVQLTLPPSWTMHNVFHVSWLKPLGVWKSKNPKLKQWGFKIWALLKKFQAWSIKHADRKDNLEAHEAAQGMITEVFVMKVDVPMYMGRETLF